MMDADRTPGLAAEFSRLAANAAATPAQRQAAQRSERAARRAQARYVDPWLLEQLRAATE